MTALGLAAVDAELGSYEVAALEYGRAISLVENGSGENSVEIARCLDGYAALLEKTGQPSEASAARARAKVIRAKAAIR